MQRGAEAILELRIVRQVQRVARRVHGLQAIGAREERVDAHGDREQIGREHVLAVLLQRRERRAHVGQRRLHEPRQRRVIDGLAVPEIGELEAQRREGRVRRPARAGEHRPARTALGSRRGAGGGGSICFSL